MCCCAWSVNLREARNSVAAYTIKVTEFPEVTFFATSTRDHRVMAKIWLLDGRELEKFIAEGIRRAEGVQRVCPAAIREAEG